MASSLLHAEMELSGLTSELDEGPGHVFYTFALCDIVLLLHTYTNCDFKKHPASYYTLCYSEVILHIFHCISQTEGAHHEKTLNRCFNRKHSLVEPL